MAQSTDIYSATYSNVPVYEYKVGSESVMRRRGDDWINATHILKVAGHDKPQRTRILEREVQKGVHEKVQGGYGKYQGTWVPLEEGRDLAIRNGILDKLAPILDFVPGDKTPPQAPKHTTAASTRVKAPKGQGRKAAAQQAARNAQHQAMHPPQDQYDVMSNPYNDQESFVQTPIDTSSMMAEDDIPDMSQQSAMSRKRGLAEDDETMLQAAIDDENQSYADQILDYWLTTGDDGRHTVSLPTLPPNYEIDKPIDSDGLTVLHWACSMGDLGVLKDLVDRGASLHIRSKNDETPLVRAVLFTNNYDKQTFPHMLRILQTNLMQRDWFRAGIFHHLAQVSKVRNKWDSTRYYAECLINRLHEVLPPQDITRMLCWQDNNGSTAHLMAAEEGSMKLANFLLLHCPEAGDIKDIRGRCANDVIREKSRQSQAGISRHGFGQYDGADGDTSDSEAQDSPFAVDKDGKAHIVMQKLAQVVNDNLKKVGVQYQRSLKGMDRTITELRQVLEQSELQAQNVHTQLDVARDDSISDEQFAALTAEFEESRKEVESLHEQAFQVKLQHRIHVSDNNLGLPEEAFNPSTNAGKQLTDEEISALLKAGRELAGNQIRRRQLSQQFTEHQANAGSDEKLGAHRQLVSLATGMGMDHLDELSEEILENLEASGPQKMPEFKDGRFKVMRYSTP